MTATTKLFTACLPATHNGQDGYVVVIRERANGTLAQYLDMMDGNEDDDDFHDDSDFPVIEQVAGTWTNAVGPAISAARRIATERGIACAE